MPLKQRYDIQPWTRGRRGAVNDGSAVEDATRSIFFRFHPANKDGSGISMRMVLTIINQMVNGRETSV